MRAYILALVALGLFSGPAAAELEEVLPIRMAAAGYTKNDPKYKLSAGPLVDYLSRGLGKPVRLVSYPGYNDVLVTLGSGGIDLAILPPIVNLHATDAGLSRPLAYGIYPTGTYTYRAYILARKRGKIASVKDLKGKKLGFVDINSASGYVFPKLALLDAGLEPKEVTDVFCGSHPGTLKALESGQVDAAAVYELLFHPADGGTRKVEDYRVLATTDPIPAEAIVAASRLSTADADKVRDLLLSFHARRSENPRWKEGRYIGFIPADPFVLAGVRRSYRRLVPETPGQR